MNDGTYLVYSGVVSPLDYISDYISNRNIEENKQR